MCLNPVRVFADVATLGQYEVGKYALDQLNPDTPLTNANGDQLSDVDQASLDRVQDPSKKAEMLMNWLIGPKPKPVNPGEDFAKSERMAGVIARADAGKGMSGLFGLGLLVGDTAPNLNLPVGQPGQEPSATPIADLTPQAPNGNRPNNSPYPGPPAPASIPGANRPNNSPKPGPPAPTGIPGGRG